MGGGGVECVCFGCSWKSFVFYEAVGKIWVFGAVRKRPWLSALSLWKWIAKQAWWTRVPACYTELETHLHPSSPEAEALPLSSLFSPLCSLRFLCCPTLTELTQLRPDHSWLPHILLWLCYCIAPSPCKCGQTQYRGACTQRYQHVKRQGCLSDPLFREDLFSIRIVSLRTASLSLARRPSTAWISISTHRGLLAWGCVFK